MFQLIHNKGMQTDHTVRNTSKNANTQIYIKANQHTANILRV